MLVGVSHILVELSNSCLGALIVREGQWCTCSLRVGMVGEDRSCPNDDVINQKITSSGANRLVSKLIELNVCRLNVVYTWCLLRPNYLVVSQIYTSTFK